MSDGREITPSDSDLPEIVRKVRARTPARLLVGRAGAAYRTGTQIELRQSFAAAKDAVRSELNLSQMFGDSFVREWSLFEVQTKARTKDEYLLRPDLGRHFDDASKSQIASRCPRECDLQLAMGDGLSVSAVAAQVPALFPLLAAGAKERSWEFGRSFVVRHCRVGILNEIGELLAPRVVILLIGERPGLATAESLSAYMSYQPDKSHTDANRNLVSNIHARGLSPGDAARRILALASQMLETQSSGYQLKAETSSPHAFGSCRSNSLALNEKSISNRRVKR
ncbi:MAG TPA: ethanolamine ammonia-lyase subunit EutC [Candidatus Aquilonibacter sp.]|nr:ethanolamine ammonia-lyase subunit EutC [Candidatus Aquilonibacter sp.]